jgi:putative ABC transport system permease protein
VNALNKKLWRTILKTRGQFLAVVVVVMLGLSVYISMVNSYYNLEYTQRVYYQDNNFADYYFHVVTAPQEIIKQIEAVPGVAMAAGRIQKDVPVIKENNQRATARVTSYPLPLEDGINLVQLSSGRLFEKYPQGGGSEILVDPAYAGANNLAYNDTVTIVSGGRQAPLTVVGTASGPEFIYPIEDISSMIPDPTTFGIIMIPHNQAQQVLDMPGQINQVLLKLVPGTDEEKVAREVKAILEPYGNLADYGREKQLSHAILQGELDQLQTTSRSLPLIFLLVAAFIQFIIVSRMVKAQRLQIGVMKALGYDNRQIILHYTGYAISVATTGAFLGSLLGLLFASYFSQTYAYYFNLPDTISGIDFRAILYGTLLSLGIGSIAGYTATRSVTGINPAESMRPEAPRSTGRIFLESWPWLWHRLDASWRMGLRTITRNWIRFGVTMLGVVLAVGLLVVSLFFNDSIDYMLFRHYEQEQKYDFLVRFAAPVRESELLDISRLDGVLKVEPVLEIPVKMSHLGRSEDVLLLGLPREVTMKNLVGEDGYPTAIPEEGILLDQKTADKLGVRTGDRITVETRMSLGPTHTSTLMVAGINQQLISSGSFIEISGANRVLQENGVVSGAMLKVEPGKHHLVEAEMNEITGIASILSRQKELTNFMQNLDAMIYFTAVMIGFAGVLGFAIVYNASIISFTERKRDLAALRVIGYTTREVSGLLFKENAVQSLLGVLLGLPLGYAMARAYISAISSDLFTIPVVVYPQTYLFSALGGLIFIMAAHLFAVRGIKKLDLVEALKNKD